MAIFLQLVFAHLIADFILQIEEVYRLKVKGKIGFFLHSCTHFMVMLILCFPFIQSHLWVIGYIAIIAFIHHYQDILKYSVQEKFPKQAFWWFTLDQISHFMFLSTSFLIPAHYLVFKPTGITAIDLFYTSPWFVLLFICFIVSTFSITYFLHAFRTSFIASSRPLHFITSFEVSHGIVERAWMVGWIIFSPLGIGLPVAISIGILRFFSPLLKNKMDFFLSAACAILIGLFFRPLLG